MFDEQEAHEDNNKYSLECASEVTAWRSRLSYIYFLRFSILLWIALPGLLLLDIIAKSLTHGLFALERPFHYFYVAFFVTIAGCVALLTARVICAYGEERFEVGPPASFIIKTEIRWSTFIWAQVPGLILLIAICWISIREAGALEILPDGAALLGGMLTAVVFWTVVSIIYYCSCRAPGDSTKAQLPNEKTATAPGELRSVVRAEPFLLPGTSMIAAWLTRRQPESVPLTQSLRTLFVLVAALNGPGYQDRNQQRQAVKNRLVARLLRRLPWSGATIKGERLQSAPLLPGHALSIVLGLGSVLAYVAIFPFTAPVPLPTATLTVSAGFGILALLWIGTLAAHHMQADEEERQQHSLRARLLSYAVPLVLLLYIPAGFALLHNVPPFRHVWHRLIPALPAIAPVIMLLIILCWTLTSCSFFWDRFRVPVIPLIAILLVGAHMFVHLGGESAHRLYASAEAHPSLRLPVRAFSYLLPTPKDHFFDLGCPPQLCSVPPSPAEAVTPSKILRSRAARLGTHPLIVITATGGGIHAAAWTAEVLGSLEHAFAVQHENFHDSVLLLSSVSGGSVGAVPFVRGYVHPETFADMAKTTWFDPSPLEKNRSSKDKLRYTLFGPTYTEEVQESPPSYIRGVTASSLEAVSWGIVYPDVMRLIWPSRTFFGLGSLEEYDRGWSMQRRMAVNMQVEDCPATRLAIKGRPKFRIEAPDSMAANIWPAECLTLRELAWEARDGKAPAVAFNATTAENGGRFLLADYQVIDRAESPVYPFMPVAAESFLHDYGASPYGLPGRSETFYPDLELLSAARLSATFPYVSPMPRLPRIQRPNSQEEVFAKSLHFGDGGYYDNDGTASAIEFLYKALVDDNESGRLNILWIEIRDDDSFDEERNPDQCTSQIVSGRCPAEGENAPPDTAPEKALSQTAAPLAAFWKAGHVSISLRDHREMAILEQAFKDKLSIYHQAFAFNKSSKNEIEPLSWHLTGAQKKELAAQIRTDNRLAVCVAQWFASCSQQTSCSIAKDICARD